MMHSGLVSRSTPTVGTVEYNVNCRGSTPQACLQKRFTLLKSTGYRHQDLKHLFPELRLLDPYQQWAQGYFCHPLARVLWHRERDIRWLGTDPRAWAQGAQGSHKNIDETGESILQVLGRVRERVPTFEFSLTW